MSNYTIAPPSLKDREPVVFYEKETSKPSAKQAEFRPRKSNTQTLIYKGDK